jgi:hypothetical protein
MDITKLSSLLTIKDDGCDVTVYLGWVPVASITEEDGFWYPSVIATCEHSSMKEIVTMGCASKEEAFAKVVKWFSP